MVTNTTAAMELVDTGEQRDRLGRKITPASRRAELVAVWRQSGLTQAAFARREGVNYTTFASWVQELCRADLTSYFGPIWRRRFSGLFSTLTSEKVAVAIVAFDAGAAMRPARSGQEAVKERCCGRGRG